MGFDQAVQRKNELAELASSVRSGLPGYGPMRRDQAAQGKHIIDLMLSLQSNCSPGHGPTKLDILDEKSVCKCPCGLMRKALVFGAIDYPASLGLIPSTEKHTRA